MAWLRTIFAGRSAPARPTSPARENGVALAPAVAAFAPAIPFDAFEPLVMVSRHYERPAINDAAVAFPVFLLAPAVLAIRRERRLRTALTESTARERAADAAMHRARRSGGARWRAGTRDAAPDAPTPASRAAHG